MLNNKNAIIIAHNLLAVNNDIEWDEDSEKWVIQSERCYDSIMALARHVAGVKINENYLIDGNNQCMIQLTKQAHLYVLSYIKQINCKIHRKLIGVKKGKGNE